MILQWISLYTFLYTYTTIFIGRIFRMELLGPSIYPYLFLMASTKLSSKNLVPVSVAISSHVTFLSLQDESGANRGLWAGCWQPNHPPFHVPGECQEPARQCQLCVGAFQGPGPAVDRQCPIHRADTIVSHSADWECNMGDRTTWGGIYLGTGS